MMKGEDVHMIIIETMRDVAMKMKYFVVYEWIEYLCVCTYMFTRFSQELLSYLRVLYIFVNYLI